MDTKKLRQKILDLAIRGKLVPQDPNDEPASVLLERIRAEKERLIKEGKIKRSKKTATDEEIEAPFEIPESWEWVKLGEIGLWQSGATPNRLNKEYYGGNIPWLKTGDLNDGYIYEIPEFITQKALEETSVKINPEGSVLIAMYGATIGKVGILTFPATTNQACCACVAYQGIEQKYLFYYLLSHREQFVMLGGGGAQPNISKEKIVDTFFPIPPMSEQKRIVSTIEQWYTIIDALESNIGDLFKVIDQAKFKILDLAIHGKLVPQDPNDEPAIDLLKRINPNFKPCNKENIPFIIPQSWEWTTISEISSSILYGVSESAKESGNYKLLRITDIQNNNVNWETVPFTDYDDKKSISYLLHDGDILFARTGATVGKSYLVEGVPQPSIYASYLIRVQTTNMILPTYIKKYFESKYYWEQITISSVGIGQPNVNGTILAGLAIPIPPYKEQQRIVTKIEELFAVLDSIKESLE